MKEIKAIYDIDDTSSIVKWRLTRSCNYHCSYCAQFLDAGHKKHVWEQDMNRLKKIVRPLRKLLKKLPGSIKIDLLGGEATYMDIPWLIDHVYNDRIKVIHLTTNFSRSLKYFKDLVDYMHNKHIELLLTASYHHECANINTYFKKVEQYAKYIKKYPEATIRVETVDTPAKDPTIIEDFVTRARLLGLVYLVERDIRDKKISTEERCSLQARAAERKKDRFIVTYKDGSEERIRLRNDLVTSQGESGLHLEGMYCTRDINFVHIYEDQAQGHYSTWFTYLKQRWEWLKRVIDDIHYHREISKFEYRVDCRQMIPIRKYRLLKKPLVCTKYMCSLCGHMSVDCDESTLMNYVDNYIKERKNYDSFKEDKDASRIVR